MDMTFTTQDLEFRHEIRQFIDQHFPSEIRRTPSMSDIEHWHRAVRQRGWAAVNWPREYGGTGWSATQKYFWDRETALAKCPGISPFGMDMLAPILMTYGSEEQKRTHLPKILSQEVRWCQGYSEPGSGSDLASLRTKAELLDDHYIVNGTKTWTSDAHLADWIFCLVRTDDTGIKQQGISFLLIDMKSPGISVYPILTLGNAHVVNSVFFEDVKVPASNLIGKQDEGWTYAKGLLTHERTGLAGVASSKAALENLKQIAADVQQDGDTLWQDIDFRNKVSMLEIDLMALEVTELRTLAEVENGKAPGPESSILKIKGTEIQQRLTELAIEASGYYAMPFPELVGGQNEPSIGPEYARDATANYLSTRVATIYGGSSEIQRNIVAKAVLGF